MIGMLVLTGIAGMFSASVYLARCAFQFGPWWWLDAAGAFALGVYAGMGVYKLWKAWT